MMTVCDDQLLVKHLAANKFNEAGIGDSSNFMQNSIFVPDIYTNFRIRRTGRQRAVDFTSRVAIEHEYLPEVCTRGAQKLQAIRLRLS